MDKQFLTVREAQLTPLALALSNKGYHIKRDYLQCPICKRAAVLASPYGLRAYEYICIVGHEVEASATSEMPDPGCHKCGGTGDNENAMCDCWIPSPQGYRASWTTTVCDPVFGGDKMRYEGAW